MVLCQICHVCVIPDQIFSFSVINCINFSLIMARRIPPLHQRVFVGRYSHESVLSYVKLVGDLSMGRVVCVYCPYIFTEDNKH